MRAPGPTTTSLYPSEAVVRCPIDLHISKLETRLQQVFLLRDPEPGADRCLLFVGRVSTGVPRPGDTTRLAMPAIPGTILHVVPLLCSRLPPPAALAEAQLLELVGHCKP